MWILRRKTCWFSPQNKRLQCAFRMTCFVSELFKKQKSPPAPVHSVASQAAVGLPWHGPKREVRVSGWSGQMFSVIAATLNILFDFDSYFPSSSSSFTPETSLCSDSVPTAGALKWSWRGGRGHRSWKQDSFFLFDLKALSRSNYF